MVNTTMIDTIRAIFTYLTALVVVVGGGLMLYLTRADVTSTDLRVITAGFIGSSLTFLFGSEVQTRTARQAAASTLAATNGSAAHESTAPTG